MPAITSMVILQFQACVPANQLVLGATKALTRRVSMLMATTERLLLAPCCYTYTYALTEDETPSHPARHLRHPPTNQQIKQTKLNQSLFKTITF